MRFIMLAIREGHGSAAPAGASSVDAAAKMMGYNKSLQKAEVLLALDGLLPPSTGVRISYMDGKPTVTHGPFAESKEVIGGYWIIVAESLAAAAAIASENPVLPHGLNFEIRPLESERGSAYRHTNETPEA